MSNRKRILRRSGLIAATVFLVSGVVSLVGISVHDDAAARQASERDRRREDHFARSQEYLEQVSRRIVRLPVDAAIPAEVESRYSAEYPEPRTWVWAVDSREQFLFGIPQESFLRANAAYDRHRPELERNGAYATRQAFLQRVLGHDIELSPARDELPRWLTDRPGDREFGLFSVPLKDADGGLLGTVYMKTREPRWRSVSAGEEAEVVAAVSGALTVLSALFLWFLLPTWVYVDARERGVPRAQLWSLLTLISLFVGLIVYLIGRPEELRTLRCPGCSREVDSCAYCPHCGRDLGTAFCSACRYPLQAGWAFCPSCRTEIGGRSSAAPPEPGAAPA